MEQGRWHFTSAQFQSGASPSEWKLRREIKSSVISSRSMGRPPALDQGALWARVEEELDTAKVRSSTRDYPALIEERRRKAELIHRRPWPTKAEATAAVHDYIAAFYNPHRRHSSLGYLSPMDYDKQHAAGKPAA
jgi:transposase InsO family protein